MEADWAVASTAVRNRRTGVRMRMSTGDAWRDRIAALLLLFAVGYNFLLAIVNAQLFAIGPSAAYAAELIAYAGCFLLGGGTLGRNGMAQVLAGVGGRVVLHLVAWLARGVVVVEWRG